MATHPKSVEAHWMPIPSYMYVENSGNPAPARDRRKVLPAMAEAALWVGWLVYVFGMPKLGGETLTT